MPLHDFHQSFNSGELSPLLTCRAGIEKYASGCSRLQNFIPLPQGPITKRPGTIYIGATHQAAETRLIGFNFENSTYGVLELGASEARWWFASNVVSAGFSHVWSGGHAATVKFAQVNNILYAVHPSHAVARFTRTDTTTISAANDFQWTYPALLDENITDTTITPSGTTGSITLTASTSIFTSANVGSYYEIAQARTGTFAEVVMGDASEFASIQITFTANPADGNTVTLNDGTARTYTFRSTGRDAIDEVGIGADADETVAAFVEAVTSGGGGADPHKNISVEEIGGLKATATLGNTAGTNVSTGQTVAIGKVNYQILASLTGAGAYAVKQGATLKETLQNLMRCINLDPWALAGTADYIIKNTTTGEETKQHPLVEAVSVGPALAATTAGAFVTGVEYEIETVGSTNFVAIGAAANTVGFRFTATGAGTGTGTARALYSSLTIRTREGGAGGNDITLDYSGSTIAWSGSAMTGGTTVLKFKAKARGAVGNSYTISKSSSAITLPGGTGGPEAFTSGADETDSASLVVLGKFEVRTTGRWTGTVHLQQLRDDAITYDTIHSWKSRNDFNVNFVSEVLKHTTLRLRFEGSGEKVDDVWPRGYIEPLDAFHRGIVKIGAYTSGTQVTATVIQPLLSTTATKFWSEGAWSPRRGYPRAVCFHKNRLWFAGTAYEPNKLWASQLGDFENFRISSSDDGGMAFQIASTDLHNILWIASFKGLVIGTTTGEWTAQEADGQSTITPTNPPVFRQESAWGSADIQGVIAGESIVFVDRYGSRVRRLFYDSSTGGYITSNLSALAEHMTNPGVTALCVQTRPEMVVWAMVDDNSNGFACLTLDPEQNVYAWSRHTATGSNYESVATVNGPDGEEVWFSVQMGSSRVITRTDVDTLNRSASAAASMVHLDCAVIAQNASPFTTVAIPDALVGKSVTIRYADGAVTTATPEASPLTVTSTTYCQVGLAMHSTMTTMPLEYALKDGSSRGRVKQFASLVASVSKTQGGNVMTGVFNENSLEALAYPLPTTTYTGEVKHSVRSSHTNNGTVTFHHHAPWPCTLTGLIVRAEIGGDAGHKPLAVDS